jgi:hypothetical protein
MASLYELSAEYAGFLDAYDNASCEEEAAEILQSLVDIHGDIEEKAEAYARVIRNVSAEAQAFRDEAKRLTKKAVAGENLVERLKQAVLDNMKVTGQKKIPTSIGAWSTQLNPMSCDVTDPDKVPERFHVKQPDKIDKAAMIREHKATGEIFDGAKLTQELGIRFRSYARNGGVMLGRVWSGLARPGMAGSQNKCRPVRETERRMKGGLGKPTHRV